MRKTQMSFIVFLLMLFSVGTMSAITVSRAYHLWSLRDTDKLGGYHTQLNDINLDTPVFSPDQPYKIGDNVSYTENGSEAYAYCCKISTIPAGIFKPSDWDKMWNIEEGWKPIGTYIEGSIDTPFYGTYNGNGHKILNLKINRPTENHVGLFGYVTNRQKVGVSGGDNTSNKLIQKVILENVQIVGKRGTGALIGKILIPNDVTNKRTVIVENCYVNGGTVKGFGATGGLVGANNSDRKQSVPIIRKCWASVTVSSNLPADNVTNSADNGNPFNSKYGGLVGCNENGITQDSYATGAVTGGDRVGGLAGCTIGGAIFRSYATGLVTQSITGNWQTGYGPIVGLVNGNLPPSLGGTNALGSVEDSYYLSSTVHVGNNSTINTIGSPLSENNFKTPSNFDSWDSTVWTLTTTEYPKLTGAFASIYYFKSNVADGSFLTKGSWLSAPVSDSTNFSTSLVIPDYLNSKKILIHNSSVIRVETGKNAYISDTTVELGSTLKIMPGGTLKIEHKSLSNLGVEFDDLLVEGSLVVNGTGKMYVGQSATVKIPGAITTDGSSYEIITGNNSTISFNGSVAYAVDKELCYLASNNSTISFNGSVAQTIPSKLNSVYNLVIDNTAGVTFPANLAVNGILTLTSGSYTSGTNLEVDGFSSPTVKMLEWEETGFNVKNFNTSTDAPINLLPTYINRSWDINGSITGTNTTKEITFYWNASEDGNYDWVNSDLVPALFNATGENIAHAKSYVLNVNTRTATFDYIFDSSGKKPRAEGLRIGFENNDTLPVELSSFTVINSQSNGVMIQWVSQSEDDLDGYRIYRNSAESLEEALMLDAFFVGTNTTQTQTYTFFDKDELSNGVYYYWLEMINYDGTNSFYGPSPVEINNEFNDSVEIPLVNGIASIYPNPFNPVTTIRYSLISDAKTVIELYNLRGQRVKLIDLGQQVRGFHNAVWDGTDQNGNNVASGIYFTKITIGKTVDMKKIVLMK